jgi:hypothetical protein
MPTFARRLLGSFGQFADVGIRAPEQNPTRPGSIYVMTSVYFSARHVSEGTDVSNQPTTHDRQPANIE